MSFFFYSPIDPKLLEDRRKKIKSLKARMDVERSWSDRVADHINSGFGSMNFFSFHVIFFTGWILLNTGILPGIPAFDPYPFGFLTMVVSLEAIFLSIFVLISQNRAAKVADVREEVDLQVNVRAEQEITQILSMLDEVHSKLGIADKNKRKVNGMKKATNLKKIEKEILQEIEEDL
jgi:uncharacterized membrane protein